MQRHPDRSLTLFNRFVGRQSGMHKKVVFPFQNREVCLARKNRGVVRDRSVTRIPFSVESSVVLRRSASSCKPRRFHRHQAASDSWLPRRNTHCAYSVTFFQQKIDHPAGVGAPVDIVADKHMGASLWGSSFFHSDFSDFRQP
jgi:hypothetical protein